MRNIPAFVDFVIIIQLFLTINRVWAAPAAPLPSFQPFTVSLEAQTGVLTGQTEELVYWYPDESTLMSQLRWEMKPLFYAGAAFRLFPANPGTLSGVYTMFSFKMGIPMESGVLEDRDWLTRDKDLSHFSSHDNATTQALMLDFRLGYSFPLGKIPVKVYGSISYMGFTWEARDGYLQYAERKGTYEDDRLGTIDYYDAWNESLPKTPIMGLNISYTQQWLILSPGVSCSLPFARFFSMDVEFMASPLIIIFADDTHWRRDKRFHDVMLTRGFYLEPRVELDFNISGGAVLSLSAAYRRIWGSRGYTLHWPTAQDNQDAVFSGAYSESSGAGYDVFDAGLLLKIRF
ncbi:MAG: omptin family outer membrane protease [Treponema sp.]|jgi:outer membrane protease|nr:omptin family outer membrane protease [Treponema sp.]